MKFYGCLKCNHQHFETQASFSSHHAFHSHLGVQDIDDSEAEQIMRSNESPELKTPKTHPNHDTVGHNFRGWDLKIYFCDSYDPRIGYWMTETGEPGNRRNVSERAIGRTFHLVRSKPADLVNG